MMGHPQPQAMPNASEASAGTKVFIDATLLEQIEATRPKYLSRTGYVNLLVSLGLAERAREVSEAMRILGTDESA